MYKIICVACLCFVVSACFSVTKKDVSNKSNDAVAKRKQDILGRYLTVLKLEDSFPYLDHKKDSEVNFHRHKIYWMEREMELSDFYYSVNSLQAYLVENGFSRKESKLAIQNLFRDIYRSHKIAYHSLTYAIDLEEGMKGFNQLVEFGKTNRHNLTNYAIWRLSL